MCHGLNQYRNIKDYNILFKRLEMRTQINIISWDESVLWLIIYESQAYIVSLFSDVVQQLWNKFRIGTTLFKFFYFFRIKIWISFYLVYTVNFTVLFMKHATYSDYRAIFNRDQIRCHRTGGLKNQTQTTSNSITMFHCFNNCVKCFFI